MTISVIQAHPVSGAFSGSFGSNVTAGNTVFLVVTGYNSANVALSNSAPTYGGGPVTGAAKLFEKLYPWDGGATDYVAAWMLPNVAGGAAGVGITMTNSLTISAVGVIAYEVAGLGSIPSADQSGTADGDSTAPSSGASGDIVHAPEFVLGAIVQDETVATIPGSPWTSVSLNSGFGNNSFAGYQIAASSGGSYTYAATSAAARWAAGVVTVKGTPSGLLMASFP